MERGDLLARQPDKAIAAFQRVIEEGELMIARQRREPEGQAREIDRAWILVDTIEAALRDKTASMKFLVLVGWNRGTGVGPARPGGNQTLADRAASLH